VKCAHLTKQFQIKSDLSVPECYRMLLVTAVLMDTVGAASGFPETKPLTFQFPLQHISSFMQLSACRFGKVIRQTVSTFNILFLGIEVICKIRIFHNYECTTAFVCSCRHSFLSPKPWLFEG